MAPFSNHFTGGARSICRMVNLDYESDYSLATGFHYYFNWNIDNIYKTLQKIR